MSTPRIKTFGDLTAALNERATAAKSAAVKKATDGDTTSEKDPADKGHVTIPKDPDAAPGKQNTPESKTNADDQTKVFGAPSPAKTISGEEKPASLAAKADGQVGWRSHGRNGRRQECHSEHATQ